MPPGNPQGYTNRPILAGLDLGAIGQAGINESQTRANTGLSMTDSYLASLLAEQQAGITGNQQAAERDFSFRRQQDQSQAAAQSQEAELQRSFMSGESERMHAFEMGQALARAQAEAQMQESQPDWFEQQRFQTNESIRQARALAAMEGEANTPQLQHFGDAEINPFRGQAIDEAMDSGRWRGDFLPRYVESNRFQEDMAWVREQLNRGLDPAEIIRMSRERFGKHAAAGSLALWEAGVRPG